MCVSAESSQRPVNVKGVDSCIVAESCAANNGNADQGILKESVDCYQNTDEFTEASDGLYDVELHDLSKNWEIEASTEQVSDVQGRLKQNIEF